MPVTCRLCGREFGMITSNHLKFKHNRMTITEYREMFPNAPIASPEWCLGVKERAIKRWANPEFKAYASQKMIEAKDTPEARQAQSERSKQLWKDPEYRAKTIEADRRRSSNPNYLRKLSEANKISCNDPEYREDLSRRKTELWAKPEFKKKMLNILQSPEHRANQRQKMIELWQTEEHQEAWTQGVRKSAKSMKHRPTKPELELFYLLNENSYPYVYIGDGSLWIGRRNPDFVWPERKLIIEMYGSHPWHDESEIEPRTKYLANYGFDTLIIWDYELKDTQQLLAKLKTFHNKNR